jgi:ABC-type Mn2+/Zn2+ transport systems, permease components
MIDHTLQTVLIGTSILGITAGALGVFAVMRQYSLLGDAISHAAFPGIAGMFLLTYTKNPYLLLLGGAFTGALGALCVAGITSYSKIQKDAALGIVLSVFFGFGLVLMTMIQKEPVASQAVLSKFLFGNASTLLYEDVMVMAAMSVIIMIVLLCFGKELAMVAFDESYAQSQGYSILVLDILLISLLIITVVIGLQTVGIILMSSLLIAPACAARQWTYSIRTMVMAASFFGALASVGGSLLSSMYSQLPTGPVIIVLLSGIVFISLLIAPGRGMLWRHQRGINE